MYLLIDNYDSFTYNLWHQLVVLGAKVNIYRNNKISVDECFSQNPHGVILSPGPCTPSQAGICLDLVKKAPSHLKILGICLGHQTIAQAFGAKIERAKKCMHGKISSIHHNEKDLFKNIPQDFNSTRYHSLCVNEQTLPPCLEITAQSQDGTIMGIKHKERPFYGLQFHPESIASEYGSQLLDHFLHLPHE